MDKNYFVLDVKLVHYCDFEFAKFIRYEEKRASNLEVVPLFRILVILGYNNEFDGSMYLLNSLQIIIPPKYPQIHLSYLLARFLHYQNLLL